MRQLQAGGGKAFNFGKSKAKLLNESKKKVTFKDVAGVDEAKEELVEIVEFLKEPKRFTKLGGRIPKGVLLIGPPGTGKTLLARAVAGEAGVPFFSISGSDFVEMFVGVGASRVRDMFEQGRRNAPCIIFIDEIDAVGRHRGAGMGGGHDEREQTLNQLLVEMDGFEGTEGVIIIAATNRVDVLDPALLRPGRFDRRVMVGRPDLNGRVHILNVHVKKVPLSSEVKIETIAKGTPGLSGADLENLVNEAALIAARQRKKMIDMDDFEEARDKVLMGPERRSMKVSEEDRLITAYHEAGHTIVNRSLPGLDPIHKVTIMPRGGALGITQTLPDKDALSFTKSKALNMIAFLFGGRAAEEIVFKDITTGASNDIERATDIATKMVTEWGMSPKIGPLSYSASDSPVFVGMQTNKGGREISDSKSQEIDTEISKIIDEGYKTALRILTEKREALESLTKGLMEFETVDGIEVDMLIRGATVEEIRQKRSDRADSIKKESDSKKEAVVKPKKQDEPDGLGDPNPMGSPA
jgi:cell division protease FtsH